MRRDLEMMKHLVSWYMPYGLWKSIFGEPMKRNSGVREIVIVLRVAWYLPILY